MKNRNWSLMALGALAAGHTAHQWTLPLGVAASLVAAAGAATLSFCAGAVACAPRGTVWYSSGIKNNMPPGGQC